MWALIEQGRVIELTDVDPENRFHESWIWQACDPTVGVGWMFSEGVFEAPPELSLEQLAGNERFWRDTQLTANEWLVARHRDEQDMDDIRTLSNDQFAQLLAYRKQLRDWPEGSAFPKSTHRPEPPEWLADALTT